MARISNKIAYPQAVPLADQDYLIGTDHSDSNATKTFSIESISEFIIDDFSDGTSYRLPVFTASGAGQASKLLVDSIIKQDTAQASGTSLLGTTITIDNGGKGNLVVSEQVNVGTDLIVGIDATIGNNLQVDNDATVAGNISGTNITGSGNLNISGTGSVLLDFTVGDITPPAVPVLSAKPGTARVGINILEPLHDLHIVGSSVVLTKESGTAAGEDLLDIDLYQTTSGSNKDYAKIEFYGFEDGGSGSKELLGAINGGGNPSGQTIVKNNSLAKGLFINTFVDNQLGGTLTLGGSFAETGFPETGRVRAHGNLFLEADFFGTGTTENTIFIKQRNITQMEISSQYDVSFNLGAVKVGSTNSAYWLPSSTNPSDTATQGAFGQILKLGAPQGALGNNQFAFWTTDVLTGSAAGIDCNSKAGVDKYADDAAAGVAGLTAGMIYQTDGTGSAPLNVAGILMVKQ